MNPLTSVRSFLQKHCKQGDRLLLALSGGPDSIALLYLLHRLRKLFRFDLALAHVDHGWRSTSGKEAIELQSLAEELGYPFHLMKLNPASCKGNLEEACRKARLQFFATLCKKHHYSAVLLGHHGDDLAETVLKRLFEGASIARLNAIKPVTPFEEIILWRPLLMTTKKQIYDWLDKTGIKFFDDETNRDPRFLRAKMRIELLPMLSSRFGKEIGSSLCHLAEESDEVQGLLDRLIAPYAASIKTNAQQTSLDLRTDRPQSPLEMRHLIRFFCDQAQVKISREAIALAAELILSKGGKKWIVKDRLFVERGILFALCRT